MEEYYDDYSKYPRCQMKSFIGRSCCVCGWEDDEYHKGVSVEEEEEELGDEH